MALLIEVTPVGEEWVVRSAEQAEDLGFTTGARAEAAARNLASRSAREGRDAEVRIYLRDGSLAGAFVYPSRFYVMAKAWGFSSVGSR